MYTNKPGIANVACATKRQTGLTLIEMIVFIVIVSIAAVAMLKLYGLTAKNSADPQLRKQALMLAEAFLEEVRLARFTFCEPSLDPLADDPIARPTPSSCSVPELVNQEVGGVGRPFDNVNDYVTQFNTASSSFNDFSSLLVDAAGSEIALPGYTVSLKIVPESLNGIVSDATPANMEVLRISVTVGYNKGQDSLTLDGYRTRYAPHAVP